MGVLDDDQAGWGLMDVARVAERLLDLVEVEGPVRAVAELANRRPDDDRVAGRLVDDEVRLGAGDDLLATREVGHLGDEIGHRPGRDEEAGLLAEQLGRPFLQGVDRRVLAPDVVTELGVGHRPAHRRGRQRDGVGAEIDDGHAGRV